MDNDYTESVGKNHNIQYNIFAMKTCVTTATSSGIIKKFNFHHFDIISISFNTICNWTTTTVA